MFKTPNLLWLSDRSKHTCMWVWFFSCWDGRARSVQTCFKIMSVGWFFYFNASACRLFLVSGFLFPGQARVRRCREWRGQLPGEAADKDPWRSECQSNQRVLIWWALIDLWYWYLQQCFNFDNDYLFQKGQHLFGICCTCVIYAFGIRFAL